MKTIIRKAEKADFENIIELLRQLWPGKDLNAKRLLQIFDAMAWADDYELLCAEHDKTLAGFASLAVLQNFWQEGTVLYITTMIVDEKHRRKGIGKALVQRVAEIARQRGCAKIELESAFHREDAHQFYEKMGFEKRAYFFSKDVG